MSMLETLSPSGHEENQFPQNSHDKTDVKEKVREFTVYCEGFKESDNGRAVFQILNTLIPFFAVYALMLASFQTMFWLTFLLTPVAAGLLVRLFIIQHDCGHGSFFKSRLWNNRVGRMMSVLTWTPYDFWRRTHNLHHASSGNLDRRGYGSIETVTVREYEAMSAKDKFLYRLYRNPFVMFLLETPFLMIVAQRIPLAEPFFFIDVEKKIPFRNLWKSVLGLNLAIVCFYGGLGFVFGFFPVAVTYLMLLSLTACIGGWLFFIQHQFEDAHWARDKEWDYHEAAVLGSSYYALPKIIQWFTGNIGLHHIHHLNAKIPNYRLQECLDGNAELKNLNRITFWESLKYARLALWDEDKKKMVTFAAV